MIRWNDFGSSLLFGAVAAAGFVPFAILAAPLLGRSGSLVAYALASAAVYLAGIGASRRQGLAAALLVAGAGAAAALLAPDPRDALLATGMIFGLCRSGLLYRSRFARALLLEGALVGAGLGVAGQLLDASTFSAVLAVWAFFLVQSVFFLIGGVEARCEDPGELDPFDAAHARVLEILEQGGAG